MRLTAFEASTDSSRWSVLVEDIRRSFGATSAYFRSPSSPGKPAAIWWVDTGTDAATRTAYVQQWGLQDPWAIHPMGHGRSATGRCFIGSQILPWQDLVNTGFYNDFGRAVGLKGVLSAMVEDGSGNSVAPQTKLALFRADGLPEFDEQQLRAFQALQPALRRALHSYWAFQHWRAAQSAMAQTLDAMPSPMCVLRRDRTIEYVNAAAKALEGQSILRFLGGKLGQVAQILESQLLASLNLAFAGIPQEIGIWMPRRNGFATAALHLTRILPDSPIACQWHHADVLMVIHFDNAARTKETRLQAISARYGLTLAERQVLRRLANGESAQAVAQAQGVGLPTVRTHIRHLLDKCHAARLVDLLRLVGD
jgi:DNA-binding CsgD family transcriptional regulator/PAS domain-containing protein